MEKLKNLLKGKTFKTCLTALSIMVLSAPMAFASGGASGGSSASTGITTAMGGVKTEFEATVAGVAPIAVGIVAIFLVWKYGMKFFKSITGSGSGN